MRLTAACLLLCLLAPLLRADKAALTEQQANDWTQKLQRVYLDPALARGDLDAHAANLVKLINEDPGHGCALFALRRLVALQDQLADLRPLHDALGELAKDDFQACTRPQEFVEAWVKLERRFSSGLAWQTTARRWGGVTEAAYIGPFADGVAPAHDDVFPPEVMLDFNAEYEGAYGRVSWRKVRHENPLEFELELFEQQRWAGYGYYVATALISDEEREARLHFAFGGPGKIWLNGEPALDADARREKTANEFSLPVRLRRGRNTVLVKISSISSLRILLRDPRGFPLRGVLAQAPGPDSPRQAVRGGTPPHESGALREVLDAAFLSEAGSGSIRGLGSLAEAEAFELMGMRERAGIAADRALETLPGQPLVRLAWLYWMGRSSLYSGSEARKLARATTDELLRADPALIPAIFEKARLLAGDERFREAVALLESALDLAPAKWRVHLQLAQVFRDAGWVTEQETALKAALKDAPAALPVLAAASDFYGALGALAREIELDGKRLELLPGDPDAHLSLAGTLARTGDLEQALKHMRILVAADPGSDFLQGRLAEALAANGKLGESLEVYELLAARSERPEQELYQAARVCLQLGNARQGAKYLERTIEVDPGHHLARRQLQRMRGESEDFWTAYNVSWEEMLRHDVTREQFPRAASALILDEQIQYVYPDGSSLIYVHQVRKILTQDGVDARGKERIQGELVTARTIKADGTVLEPISQAGGLIEFPGVEIGALLDVAYLQRVDGGPVETLNGDAFYFIDQHLAEPFAISRWVLVAPKAMPINPVFHNLRAGDPGVVLQEEAEGELLVRTWDVRNPRLPEHEQFMPSPLEVIPWVECVRPRDWRERARQVADDGLRKIINTPLLHQRAVELTQGLDTDEDKARAIYAWVNATFTTLGDAWNAHQALKAGAGDRLEIFVSLCAAAEVRLGFACADPPPVYKQPPEESLPRPHWAYPHKEDFEHFFVVVTCSNGALRYIELKDRMRPFGEIPARMFNAPVILWLAGRYELTHLPGGDREKDRFENRVHVRLDADGSAQLEGSITVVGERSYGLKEAMRTTPNDELCNELEADLAQHYKGFEVSECRFPQIGDVGEPLVQEYDGEVKQLATATADGLSLALPGEKLGRLLSLLVGARKREFDVVLDFDLVQTDEIRISPPEGYVFKDLPKDLLYPTAPLVYELKFRIEDGDMVVRRKLVLGPGRFTPADYNDLVEQVKQIRQSEDSTLKLAKDGS
ncbi:MAG: hypothetical protein H6841_06750 [Planctomycetes bacterium]|nr:hypothetical protein [Planctomycetota bacterium]MCB9935330.1 hypothetical protein [Planctomycetota bacterium]